MEGRPAFPTCQGGFPEAVCAPLAVGPLCIAPPRTLPLACPYRLQLVCPSSSWILGRSRPPSLPTLQTSPFFDCTAFLINVALATGASTKLTSSVHTLIVCLN